MDTQPAAQVTRQNESTESKMDSIRYFMPLYTRKVPEIFQLSGTFFDFFMLLVLLSVCSGLCKSDCCGHNNIL